MLGALCEHLEAKWLGGEDADFALLATLGNAQRRMLESIGLQRRARDVTPTLADIHARIAAHE